jgi:hypothetical protein
VVPAWFVEIDLGQDVGCSRLPLTTPAHALLIATLVDGYTCSVATPLSFPSPVNYMSTV